MPTSNASWSATSRRTRYPKNWAKVLHTRLPARAKARVDEGAATTVDEEAVTVDVEVATTADEEAATADEETVTADVEAVTADVEAVTTADGVAAGKTKSDTSFCAHA